MTYYWDNGEIRAGSVALPLGGPAFRFGCGLFETVYYNGRRVCHLDLHLDRLRASMRELAIPFHEADPGKAAAEVITANELTGHPARINIYYPVVEAGAPARPLIAAWPYQARPEMAYRLDVSPGPHESPLSRHKTQNRMDHFLALERARRAGFDEALLLDRDGYALEGTFTSLLFARGGSLVEPETPWKLPGIAMTLARRAAPIGAEPVHASTLACYDHAYVLNSLIGVRPAVRIGELELAPDEATCARLTEAILPAD